MGRLGFWFRLHAERGVTYKWPAWRLFAWDVTCDDGIGHFLVYVVKRRTGRCILSLLEFLLSFLQNILVIAVVMSQGLACVGGDG